MYFTNSMSVPKFTPKRRQTFLTHLRETGLIGESAELACSSYERIRRKRKNDSDFDVEVTAALTAYHDLIETEIHRRAIIGTRKPVFYQGTTCGHIREYSDRLLEFHAKRHIPAYREKQSIDMNVAGGVLVVPGVASDSKDWEERHRGEKVDG